MLKWKRENKKQNSYKMPTDIWKPNKMKQKDERRVEKYVKLSMTYLLCVHLTQWSRLNEQSTVFSSLPSHFFFNFLVTFLLP